MIRLMAKFHRLQINFYDAHTFIFKLRGIEEYLSFFFTRYLSSGCLYELNVVYVFIISITFHIACLYIRKCFDRKV